MMAFSEMDEQVNASPHLFRKVAVHGICVG
jgi:hypothetical protein